MRRGVELGPRSKSLAAPPSAAQTPADHESDTSECDGGWLWNNLKVARNVIDAKTGRAAAVIGEMEVERVRSEYESAGN